MSQFRLSPGKAAAAWTALFGETLTISDEYIEEVKSVSELTSIILKFCR